MPPALRDAEASDLPAIAALYGREVEGGTATFEITPPPIEEMARRFAAVKGHGLPWLVAEVDGRFAGYAYASPFRPRPAYRYGVEGSIYVEEDARGRGVGRALLVALIDRARAMGLRHVIGAISDSDTSAASIALHRSLGFRQPRRPSPRTASGPCSPGRSGSRRMSWSPGRAADMVHSMLCPRPRSARCGTGGWRRMSASAWGRCTASTACRAGWSRYMAADPDGGMIFARLKID